MPQVDASAQIAGSCLEQTTWLRRNLEVNPQLLRGESEADEKAYGDDQMAKTEEKRGELECLARTDGSWAEPTEESVAISS